MPDAREQILAAADGNPLFLEEMLALAREDGAFRVPGTVQALLQARLDQLGGRNARCSSTGRWRARCSTAAPWSN